MLCSIIGLSPTFNSGFGVFSVNGRNLFPSPPAINTASTGITVVLVLKFIFGTLEVQHIWKILI